MRKILYSVDAGLIRFTSSVISKDYAPAHIEDPDEAGRTLCGIEFLGKRMHQHSHRFHIDIDCTRCGRRAKKVFGERRRTAQKGSR